MIAKINLQGALMYMPKMDTPKELNITNTYEVIKDLVEIKTREDIQGVILVIDSQGGTAQGISEVIKCIDELRLHGKEIIAYVTKTCASAAYHIACACDSIIATQSADIGAIGAVMVIDNTSDDNTLIIRSKQAEYKYPSRPLSDEYIKYLQSNIDESGDEFIQYVQSRRLDINNDAFNGKIYRADKALSMAMIDNIVHLSDMIDFID